MAGLINIGLTGVLGHQTALNTTGNNITNVNTPGYSRQEVVFETQPGRQSGWTTRQNHRLMLPAMSSLPAPWPTWTALRKVLLVPRQKLAYG